MNEKNQDYSFFLDKLDLYSVIRDTLKSLWVIVLGALAVGMVVNMVAKEDHQNTYSTTATLVVTSKTSSNYAYSNLSAASTVANTFSNILNSNLLKKKVCAELELPSFDAKTSAKVISGTNLMTLMVTSDAPKKTYQIARSIMNNITDLSQYVSADMVIDILQEPAVPTKPDKAPLAERKALRGFVISGALLALAFMYLSYRKETIKSEKDLENKLDAKSLGMIYHEGKYGSVSAFLRRKKTEFLVTDLTARFEYVERFKKITAHVSSEAHKKNAKVILVTSVREHEGKSTVSSNLALTLVQQSYKVLLIDGDMRRPTLNKLFLDSPDKLKVTLAAALAGKADLSDALYQYKDQELYMLLNKRSFQNSTDIVSSEEMEKLVSAARKHFDFIVIDSPPMSLMADAEVLANLADLSILVVAYDSVLAQDLNDAIDSLRDCRASFAGCILNQVRTLPGERRTTGGYGGYGRYGVYGRYGRYGADGSYGSYGRYAENAKES